MNAIILAAGLGSRFNEITKTTHKSLLPIGGKPNIERTIEYFHDFGINEIIIVTGHLSESFDYLTTKYDGIKLKKNDHYYDYNNIYSFYIASPDFSDSFVIDADMVMLDNVLSHHETSVYYTLQRKKSADIEWIPLIGDSGFVSQVEISSAQKPSMFGISFWRAQDCEMIKKALPHYLDEETLSNPKLYWENIQIDNYDKLQVRTNQIDARLVDEMDTVENYNDILQKFANL